MLIDTVLVVLFIGITAYAVLGGADFGAGFWDLLAGGPEKGRPQRVLIEKAIGPVWETNHVWLIFVLVVLWTCFPPAYASIASTLYIPLTLVAIGIILRGAGFAMRKLVDPLRLQRFYGGASLSSLITPFFLGAVAGAIASGRIPVGNAAGNPITSWLNAVGLLGGTLAVLTCAFVAAVFLSAEAQRRDEVELSEGFRARALVMGAVTGVVALGGIFVLRSDAPSLADELLTGRALPLVVLSAVAGLSCIALLWARRFSWARIAAAAAVAAIVWGWGAGQYPYLLEDTLTVEQGAAGDATLVATLVGLGVGALVLIPSFILLYTLNLRDALEEESALEESAGLHRT